MPSSECECEETGIAYVAFSMWAASIFQFTGAMVLMQKEETAHDRVQLSGTGDGFVEVRVYKTALYKGQRDAGPLRKSTGL